MGAMRSYWDFICMGLGLVISIFLTMEAVVFWQLGSLAKTEDVPAAAGAEDVFCWVSGAAVVSCRVLLCRAGHHGVVDCAVPGIGDLEFAPSHSAAVSGVKAGDWLAADLH